MAKIEYVDVKFPARICEAYQLVTASAYKNKGDKTFGVSFMIDKKDKNAKKIISELRAAVITTCKSLFGDKYKEEMEDPDFWHAIRNGDTDKLIHKKKDAKKNAAKIEVLKGHFFLKGKAKEDSRPDYIVIRQGRYVELTDDEEIQNYFYPGAKVGVAMSVGAYSGGDGGYSFWLNKVIFIGHGEKLKIGSGGESAESTFEGAKWMSDAMDVDNETFEDDEDYEDEQLAEEDFYDITDEDDNEDDNEADFRDDIDF